MKQLLYTPCLAVLLLLSTYSFAQDLKVSSIDVTNIDGNKVTFTYKVTNIAFFSSLELKRLEFRTYISENHLFDNSDKFTGTAIFGNNAPTLGPGQSYTGSFTASSLFNFQKYENLLFQVQVRSGYTSQETNLSNNFLAHYMRFDYADLELELGVSNVKVNTLTYTCTVKNTGHSMLHLERHTFKAYIYPGPGNTGEVVIGQGPLVNSPLAISPGSSYSFSKTVTPSVSIEKYYNLHVDVALIPGKAQPQYSLSNDNGNMDMLFGYADLDPYIQVESIDGNKLNLSYTIYNTGFNSSLYLHQFYYNIYLSKDNTNDPSMAVLINSGTFSQEELILPPHPGPVHTYKKFITVPFSINPQLYSNIIFEVKLQNSYQHPQRNKTNDKDYTPLQYIYPDLLLDAIRVDSLVAQDLYFNIDIRNVGNSNLHVDRYGYRVYFSQNNTLESTDVLASSGILSAQPISLDKGELYNASIKSNILSIVPIRPYLIVDIFLLGGQIDYQLSDINDTRILYLIPTLCDFAVNNIEFESSNKDSVTFEYTISNQGKIPLHLEDYRFKTYLSADNVFDPSDRYAGGGAFLPNNRTLKKNEYFQSTYTSKAPGTSITDHHFLIFKVEPLVYQNEQNYTNNQYITYVPILSAARSSEESWLYHIAHHDDALTMENLQEGKQHTSYAVYSMQGTLISEGSFEKQLQLPTTNMPSGLYILRLSDGTNQEQVKFFINQ